MSFNSEPLYEKTSNPTASEDFAAGYFLFDRWLNTSTNEEFVCVADGVWKNTTATPTSGGSSFADIWAVNTLMNC